MPFSLVYGIYQHTETNLFSWILSYLSNFSLTVSAFGVIHRRASLSQNYVITYILFQDFYDFIFYI